MTRLFYLFILFLLQMRTGSAQFYYKEIIGNKLAMEELQSYKKRNIHQINIKSFEPSDIVSEGFYCEKKISKDYKKTTVFSKTNETGKSILTSYFNEKGYPIKTYDSSENHVRISNLQYNDLNQIIQTSTVSRSKDDDFVNEVKEDHSFLYNENNQLTKLIICKNQSDTTIILFYTDEKGNTAIEKNTKNAAKYYYYFDDKNRLADVVFSNEFKKRMVTEYEFDYDENDQIFQMITSKDDNNNRMIWKYDYENGLKIKERIFSANNSFIGKVIYEYH